MDDSGTLVDGVGAMIRFQPDTWRDALWRPISMAAPDAGVYMEVMAPDLRFALLLVVLAFGIAVFRRSWRPEAITWRLLAFLGLEFAIWIYTSGNGRYFTAGLMLVGVGCVSLLHRWPVTRSLSLTLAMACCVMQAYTVYLAAPFEGSSYAPWRDAPVFPIDLPSAVTEEPATYVTISTNTYSLIAPRAHRDSRWLNLALRQTDLDDGDVDGKRIKRILSQSQRIRAVLVGVRGMLSPDGRLAQEFIDVMNERFAPLHLAFDSNACTYVTFKRSSNMNVLDRAAKRSEGVVVPGFMFCDLKFLEQVPANVGRVPFPPEVDQVMAVMDQQCARFFNRRSGAKFKVPHGTMVHYGDADMKLFVLDDRRVEYRYWRSLMAEPMGTVEDVLRPGYLFDCEHIRGRSGLPWERRY